ncbi:MAG: DUF4344 domain-containing metallopeptidase [Xanthobacteraceae bacterium]
MKDFTYAAPAMPGQSWSPPTPGLMPGITRGEVIVGGTVSLVLHELGHAVRHNLDLPRLGREEDSADQISGFIMLQFGEAVALPTIKGTINVWHHRQAQRLRASKGAMRARNPEQINAQLAGEQLGPRAARPY